MPRITRLLLVLGVSLVCVPPASGAPLFEDTFEDESAGDPLNATDWKVSESTSEVSVKVAEVSSNNWAAFDFTSSAANTDIGRAWTQSTWRIDNDGPLTWEIDFQMAAGTRSTIAVPFVFDTDWDDDSAASNKYYKDTDVCVTVYYADDGAVANIYIDGVAWGTFRDSSSNLFEPSPDDRTIYALTMTLNDTKAIGEIKERDDDEATIYTAEYAHGLTLSTPGHCGMQAYNNNGADAKTIQYDNVLLTPEPATAVLIGLGGLIVGLARRRAA